MIGNPSFYYKPIFVVLFLFVLTVGGCQSRNEPVRSDVALATLKSTLENWKQGEDISVCGRQNPAVVVQDMDWMAGKKLQDYQVINQKPKDANLFVTVELKLAENSNSNKTVVYCVGTDPVLTVFRTMDGKEIE